MLFASTDFKLDHEQHFLEEFQNRTVDGLIVLLADETAERSVELLKRSRVPVVLIDRDVVAPLDFVLSDHKTAMTQVVRYLMSLGHTKIGLIVPPMTMRPGRERFNAFCAEMLLRGHPTLEGYIRTAIQTPEEGYRAAIDILRHPDRPTALIVGANQHIFGAMRAVRELNLSIPGELSIVGADENVASGLIEPPLTVIWRDMNLVGESAARLLLDRLGSRAAEPPRTITIRSEIILRESCGPAPTNTEPRGTRLGGE